ncbi:ras-related protein Rab-34-like [Pollicipes pollicipes]|uniref:ras-related protein Rab-34-like n=1 Tax=Pollicipes pollicipes TaxID=41117 RepID=UPI001885488D|nr:ras-related protein Rab-34-like [Pollicipes pollicipes]
MSAELPSAPIMVNAGAAARREREREREPAELDRRLAHLPPPPPTGATRHRRDFDPRVKDACLRDARLRRGLKISKAIVLGDAGVGKTSLVNRFCHQVFDHNYKATVGVDFEVERFDVLGVPFSLQVWDTAGQERFRSIAAAYYRGARAALLCFDLTDLMSLSHTAQWCHDVLEANPAASPPLLFLVGTKRDLVTPPALAQVLELAAGMATTLGAELWTVSARAGLQVDALFCRVAALTFDASVAAELVADDAGRPIGDAVTLSATKRDGGLRGRRVTTPDGAVFVERRGLDGRLERRPAGATLGYVVNPRPDLQVGRPRPWLCLGSQDVAHDLPLLRQLGVTHVLNVATGVRDLFPQELTYLALPLLDVPEQPLANVFPAAFDFIEAARGAGGLCLVHCNAGVSRSAALVTAYLMERQGLSFSEALQLVNETRRVRPNPGFQSQLIDFGRQLREQRETGAR